MQKANSAFEGETTYAREEEEKGKRDERRKERSIVDGSRRMLPVQLSQLAFVLRGL